MDRGEFLRRLPAVERAFVPGREDLPDWLDAAGFGFGWYSVRTGETYCDARIRALFGFDAREPLSARKLFERVHPDDAETVCSAVIGANRGDSCICDYRVLLPDGRTRRLTSWARPLLGESGSIERVFGLAAAGPDTAQERPSRMPPDGARAPEDIAVQRRMADTLRENDRQRNEFLATVAHELRNPLAPIQNALIVLRLVGTGGESELNVIERQLAQMTRLVDDLLDIARLSHDKLTLHAAHIDLREPINMALEQAAPLIQEKRQSLELIVPPRPLPVKGDRERLAQVFANLLNNAARYTHSSGHIGLYAERRKSRICVTVADDGIGISAEQLPRVFDMFAQGKRGQPSDHGGLGVGLALVRALVHMHQGSVCAESPGRGRGATFRVCLPLDAPMKSKPPARRQPAR